MENFDFRLFGNTAPGIPLDTPFNIDFTGVTRGVDGIWDRGAYEYNQTSGIQQIDIQNPFILFHNPAIDYVYIEFTANSSLTEIALHNLTEETIKSITYINIAYGKEQMKIDLSDIEPGIYIITAITRKKSYSKKLI